MTGSRERMANAMGITLGSAADALDLIASGAPGCIVTPDAVSASFFDLTTGVAGDVFQKFINYRFPVAFVVPPEHPYGARVTELAREYTSHPVVRIVSTVRAAEDWLASLD